MECPFTTIGCVMVDTGDMTKPPCEECEIYIEAQKNAEQDKENEFMMGL